MGKYKSLQQIMLGKLNIHMQKNETEHSVPHKIQSKILKI